jgi:hypothetical protein
MLIFFTSDLKERSFPFAWDLGIGGDGIGTGFHTDILSPLLLSKNFIWARDGRREFRLEKNNELELSTELT